MKPELKQINDLTSPTVMYADKAVGVGVGPGVSKLFFGNEGNEDSPIASFSVVLPTHALMDLTRHLVASFAEDGVVAKQLAEQWKGFAETMPKFESSLAREPATAPTKKAGSKKS